MYQNLWIKDGVVNALLVLHEDGEERLGRDARCQLVARSDAALQGVLVYDKRRGGAVPTLKAQGEAANIPPCRGASAAGAGGGALRWRRRPT
eukprot:5252688-Pleurochrysis_carterae.AAC.1